MIVDREIEVTNKLGLHARAAAKVVNTAHKFASTITLTYDDRDADAASIMALMTLAAAKGSVLIAKADGEDADQAMSAIVELFSQRFGEEE